MSWSMTNPQPFRVKAKATCRDAIKAALVTNGDPPFELAEEAIDVAAQLLPLIGKTGPKASDLFYVAISGHEADIRSVTVSVSAGQRTEP